MTSQGLKPTLYFKRHFSLRSPMPEGMGWARALIRTHSWIGWGAFWIILSAVDPCAAMIQASQEPQPLIAQSTPAPAADTTPMQISPTPIPQPSTNADNAARAPSPYDEIVVTAVGDVMLGTAFP